jgi:mono/diheme cytochrome c family protein
MQQPTPLSRINVSPGSRRAQLPVHEKMSLVSLRSQSFPLVLALAFITSSVPGQALSKSKAGAALFRDKGCAYCHGITAAGTTKGPSLDSVRKAWKPAQITDQIQNGGQKMPAFKDAVSNEEITQLIAWIRAKHRPVAPPAPVPAEPSLAPKSPSQPATAAPISAPPAPSVQP